MCAICWQNLLPLPALFKYTQQNFNLLVEFGVYNFALHLSQSCRTRHLAPSMEARILMLYPSPQKVSCWKAVSPCSTFHYSIISIPEWTELFIQLPNTSFMYSIGFHITAVTGTKKVTWYLMEGEDNFFELKMTPEFVCTNL